MLHSAAGEVQICAELLNPLFPSPAQHHLTMPKLWNQQWVVLPLNLHREFFAKIAAGATPGL